MKSCRHVYKRQYDLARAKNRHLTRITNNIRKSQGLALERGDVTLQKWSLVSRIVARERSCSDLNQLHHLLELPKLIEFRLFRIR